MSSCAQTPEVVGRLSARQSKTTLMAGSCRWHKLRLVKSAVKTNALHCASAGLLPCCCLCRRCCLALQTYCASCSIPACRLYANVVSTIKGYGDYFWVDVVEKIDEWGEQVQQFKNQCSKLPKALRDWQAFVDCRNTIDNFLNMLPLFQALASKAMRDRHWNQVCQITGAQPTAIKTKESCAHRPVHSLLQMS